MSRSRREPPKHYGSKDWVYEPFKVIRAWGLSYHLGDAAAYIERAGKKQGASAADDIEKAIDHLVAELEWLRSEARETAGK